MELLISKPVDVNIIIELLRTYSCYAYKASPGSAKGQPVNRKTNSKLGLKVAQNPLKYATSSEAELRPGKTQQSGGQTHPLGAKMVRKGSDHFHE